MEHLILPMIDYANTAHTSFNQKTILAILYNHMCLCMSQSNWSKCITDCEIQTLGGGADTVLG